MNTLSVWIWCFINLMFPAFKMLQLSCMYSSCFFLPNTTFVSQLLPYICSTKVFTGLHFILFHFLLISSSLLNDIYLQGTNVWHLCYHNRRHHFLSSSKQLKSSYWDLWAYVVCKCGMEMSLQKPFSFPEYKYI